MTQDNSAQFIKEHGEIMAAGEAAKRAADAKTAQDIASRRTMYRRKKYSKSL